LAPTKSYFVVLDFGIMKTNTNGKGKPIGLVAAISIGVGGMIGAGIFSIFGVGAEIAGNAVYLSFIIAGIIALFCAYSYAKLGSIFPSAGGPVEFLVRGFGSGITSGGFNILLWIAYIFALALYARAFASYAVTFFPNLNTSVLLYIFMNVVILGFVLVEIIGAKAVGRSEIFIVGVKLAILVLFIIAGSIFIKPALLTVTDWPSSSNILFAAGILFLGYPGFGLITNATEDVTEPKKMLPKAIYLSIIIVIAIYALIAFTVLGNLGVDKIIEAKDYALAAAAKPFLGNIGFGIMAVAALFSTASAINATLYGGANVSYVLAKNGQLPAQFNRRTWHGSTEGLFITAALVLIFANFFQLGGIAMLGSAAFLIIYGAVNVAHLKLRKETGGNKYIILVSTLLVLLTFILLVYYLSQHSMTTLITLIIVVCLCFLAELILQKMVGRKMLSRNSNTKY
jgi:amino acid transporter